MAFLYEKIIKKIDKCGTPYDLCSYEIKSLGYEKNLIGFKIIIDDNYSCTDDMIKLKCTLKLANQENTRIIILNHLNGVDIDDVLDECFEDCFSFDIFDIKKLNIKNIDKQIFNFFKEFKLDKFYLVNNSLVGPSNNGAVNFLSLIA